MKLVCCAREKKTATDFIEISLESIKNATVEKEKLMKFKGSRRLSSEQKRKNGGLVDEWQRAMN